MTLRLSAGDDVFSHLPDMHAPPAHPALAAPPLSSYHRGVSQRVVLPPAAPRAYPPGPSLHDAGLVLPPGAPAAAADSA